MSQRASTRYGFGNTVTPPARSPIAVLEAYVAATIIYVMVTLVVVFGMRWVEKKVAVPGLISAGGAPMAGH